MKTKEQLHRLNCFVENKPGVLARIVGLISGRGYNIQTLNVGPTEDGTVSQMRIDVLGTERVPWVNDKIGPTASPIKTKDGWLTLFHAVDRDDARGKNGWEATWKKRYTAGLMLLDLQDPSKVLALYDKPLLAPDLPVETDEGFRQNVIFPCAMLLEDDGEVKIYYGASDTCVCLATAKLDDLLELLK